MITRDKRSNDSVSPPISCFRRPLYIFIYCIKDVSYFSRSFSLVCVDCFSDTIFISYLQGNHCGYITKHTIALGNVFMMLHVKVKRRPFIQNDFPIGYRINVKAVVYILQTLYQESRKNMGFPIIIISQSIIIGLFIREEYLFLYLLLL